MVFLLYLCITEFQPETKRASKAFEADISHSCDVQSAIDGGLYKMFRVSLSLSLSISYFSLC